MIILVNTSLVNIYDDNFGDSESTGNTVWLFCENKLSDNIWW
jgi:hypothetical protein